MWDAARVHALVPGLLVLASCGGFSVYRGGGAACDSADPSCATANDIADTDVDCADPAADAICDADGDGAVTTALGGDDCDDADPAIHPAADELCDDIDNNCNGSVDEDSDGDGSAACDDCDVADPARHPDAVEICGDEIDSDCDGDDCLIWLDDFESGQLSQDWVLGGGTPWRITNAQAQEGSYSVMSGQIGDGQSTFIELALEFPGGGTVTFWHTGSTEEAKDRLVLSVDGKDQAEWSGTWDWQEHELTVGKGSHTVRWRYQKDISGAAGFDVVGIDLVGVEGGRRP